MEGYTDADRQRDYDRAQVLEDVIARVRALERGQRISLRRIRRLPDLTATAIVQAVSKRALLLIGAGIALGSALGGAGIEIARKLLLAAFPALGAH